jgi:hypothetical protein
MSEMRRLAIGNKTGTGQLPFLDAAFDKGIVSNGSEYAVLKVKENLSKSGYCIYTSDFMSFIFKSSPMAELLIETLEDLSRINPAPALLVEVDDSQAEGFHLGLSDDKTFCWQKSKKFGNLALYTRCPAKSSTSTPRVKNG